MCCGVMEQLLAMGLAWHRPNLFLLERLADLDQAGNLAKILLRKPGNLLLHATFSHRLYYTSLVKLCARFQPDCSPAIRVYLLWTSVHDNPAWYFVVAEQEPLFTDLDRDL